MGFEFVEVFSTPLNLQIQVECAQDGRNGGNCRLWWLRARCKISMREDTSKIESLHQNWPYSRNRDEELATIDVFEARKVALISLMRSH